MILNSVEGGLYVFEKLTRKLSTRAVDDVKRTVKEESVKCADDLLPAMVGIASIALLLLANVPPQKLATQQIVINNFYIGR